MTPRVVISAPKIRAKIRTLGTNIARAHERPHLIGVLQAGFVFLADLMREIPGPSTCDTISASSYRRGRVSSGRVRLFGKPRRSLRGRDVIIVDTIVETGRTLRAVRGWLRTRRPRSIAVCALLKKPGPTRVDYLGFRVPRKFVVGYGLDHAGAWRHLPHIAVIE